MFTPQEATDFVFEKALIGGYDIASVDGFLAQLTQDYSTLYKENGILKTKLKVLVDKVEEYRSTEDAMRMALLQAEKTAKDIVAEAEAERDSIDKEIAQKRSELLQEAEAEAEKRREELRQELAVEEAALLNAKRATSDYLARLKSAMAEYAETVSRVYDFVEPLPPQPEPEPKESAEEAPPPPEEPKESGVSQDTVERIATLINRTFSSPEMQEKPAEPAADQDTTITKLPVIDYDNLQFGNTYSAGKK